MTADSHHRAGGGFRNPWPGAQPHGLSGLLKWAVSRRPPAVAPAQRTGSSSESPTAAPRHRQSADFSASEANALTITWIGHSTFLIQCDGVNILTDPIWSRRASPVSFAGPERAVPPGVPFENLPEIHATLVSHDHYDHLDDPTVGMLIERFPRMHWLVPLGVGEFMRRRSAANVIELDWWDERRIGSIKAHCTPAQHFSGRFPWNRDSTLWCGWAISVNGSRVFFAGDTGLHTEFGRISMRYGPFDAAILPIGAYEPRWFMRPVHMDPAESVAAYQQLVSDAPERSCVMIASHWGTFKLTDEPLSEPPLKAREAWASSGLNVGLLAILAHGESRIIAR